YRFHEAANLVYQFFWGDLCEVYIEAVKLRLDFSGGEKDQATQALKHLVRIFEGSLRLLSPFMPFITEEIWHALYEQKAPAKSIALTRFPIGAELTEQQKSITEHVRILRELLTDIRNRRVELDVAQNQKVPVRIFTTDSSVRKLVESNREFLERRAMAETIDFATESMSKVAGVQARSAYEVAVVYEKKIDVAAERDRLSKELKKLESDSGNAERQLGNESFLAKAPANVVDGLRRRHAELEQLITRTRAALEELDKGGTSPNGSHG
ncbi:MAG TPA: class I tRNA ligase family protein, partial [Terriglobales bacterium]|nr:class I tRNA ligase family protein [Terriglobales bacterium]